MSVVSYVIAMVFLSIVWLVSWEFMRQENAQLREKNRRLRDDLTRLYADLDRYRPKRNAQGKFVNMRDWMEG